MQVFPATFGSTNDERSLTIFDRNNRLKITRFQRTYTWEEPEWELLISDLLYMQRENVEVAWPSVILQESQDPEKPNRKIYWIGDGQQRITTVYVCLLAIWHSIKSRSQENSEIDNDWINRLLPDIKDKENNVGLLGEVIQGKYGLKVDPKIIFSSEQIQDDLASLMDPLNERARIAIDQRIDDPKSASGVLEAFIFFLNWSNNESSNDLKEYSRLIFNNIRLSAVVFSKKENMERAYGNMNSGGKPLTEDELIKARIYNSIKSKLGEEHSDKMARYWIEEFEESSWWRELGTTRSTAKFNRLHIFLEEKLKIETNWVVEAKRDVKDSLAKKRYHWLSRSWDSHLREVETKGSQDEFWSDFKKDKENFEIILGKNIESYPKGSANWLANYAYSVFGLPSILLYLMRAIDDQEELKKTLWLFIRYMLFLILIGEEGNFLQVVIKSGSPITSKNTESVLNYNSFLKWFTSMGKKAKWVSQEVIKEKLENRSFKPARNVQISDLFVYVNNVKAENNRNRESLFSGTYKDTLDSKKSREHILSQKPPGFETWSEQAQKSHTELVGKLGNSLVIASNKNAFLQNSEVSSKIKTYKEETNSPVGSFWVQDFLDDYIDAGSQWGEEEIINRSKKIAEEIAPYLSAPKSDA